MYGSTAWTNTLESRLDGTYTKAERAALAKYVSHAILLLAKPDEFCTQKYIHIIFSSELKMCSARSKKVRKYFFFFPGFLKNLMCSAGKSFLPDIMSHLSFLAVAE